MARPSVVDELCRSLRFLGTPLVLPMEGNACQGSAVLIRGHSQQLDVRARGWAYGADDERAFNRPVVAEGKRQTPYSPWYFNSAVAAAFGDQ
ncbi:hypothetical protein MycrhN_3215 [Mycolicibacterium rhodesiae NBB3]|uniref:Uncharacterized protein n=1 Tax=Mycolicibacterium rhodesiae (strain NBB3) TaxID=710685 RepID=G8RNP6_MYCRN|nr:hypothetical protein MycrhN_3215 [Mycolicibacterium rhodesiae NBB3]